ncbi:hypothetical protein [Eggerthia catenaformis]
MRKILLILMLFLTVGCKSQLQKTNTQFQGSYEKDKVQLIVKKADDPKDAYYFIFKDKKMIYEDYALKKKNQLVCDLEEEGVQIIFDLGQDIDVKIIGKMKDAEKIRGNYRRSK